MVYHVEPGLVAGAIKAADKIEKFFEEHEDMDSMLYEEAVVALSVIRLQLKYTAWQFVPPKPLLSVDQVRKRALEAIDKEPDEGEIRRIIEDAPLDDAKLVVELRELVEPLINWDRDRE